MAGGVTPYIEAAWYLFGVKDLGHLLIVPAADVIGIGCKNAGIAAIQVKVVRIVQVRHVMGRQIKVTVLVVVTGKEVRGVKGAAHRKDAGEDIRVPESDVDRMVTAEAAPDSCEVGGKVSIADKGDDFAEEVPFELHMTRYAGAGKDGAVIPALCIN